MYSHLITGGTYDTRIKTAMDMCGSWSVLAPDIFQLHPEEEKKSLGIGDIRLFTKRLYLSPGASPLTVGIIDQADLLTAEAQNALLKTLEEPPQKSRIILCVPQADILLPTILSRCKLIRLGQPSFISDEEQKKILDTVDSLKEKTPGEILQYVSLTFSKKDAGAAFLHTYLHVLHIQLLSLSTSHSPEQIDVCVQKIHAVTNAGNRLSANVSPLLIFDTLFLTLFPRQKINPAVQ